MIAFRPYPPRLGLAVPLALSLLAAPGSSQVVTLHVTAEALQETSAVTSSGFGTGTIDVDTAADTADISFTFANLTSATNMAHVHGLADPGVAAGILQGLPITSPITFTWNYSLLPSEETALVEGHTYLNIHTTMFPGGEIRGTAQPATSFCSGDGSGTACPCGNDSALPGRGCKNSSGQGAILMMTGNNDASAPNNEFFAQRLLPSQPALLFMGLNAIAGGNGAVFGDGLRCAGAGVVRLGVKTPNASGQATWTPTILLAPGSTRHFQGWYRNPTGSPCGALFNLTNGLTVTFH